MADTIALRRLDILSDTVFGVAMTFMAYRLPVPDRSGPAPDWSTLAAVTGPHLVALLLSFFISVVFWLSHHRRLALSPPPGAAVLALNLAFLLLVILLPVTSDVFGTYGARGVAVTLYACHLAAVSLLNLGLWLIVVVGDRGRPSNADWRMAAGPGAVTAVFAVAAIVSLWRPVTAEYIMFGAFARPLVSAALRRKSMPQIAGDAVCPS